MLTTKTAMETVIVLIGAGIGAVGALMVNPIIIGGGALVSTLAVGKHILDKRKAQANKTKSSMPVAACS